MWPYNPVAHGWPCHGHLMKTRYLTSPISSAKNYRFPALHGLVLHSHVLEASYSSVSVIMVKQVEIQWYGKFNVNIVNMFLQLPFLIDLFSFFFADTDSRAGNA